MFRPSLRLAPFVLGALLILPQCKEQSSAEAPSQPSAEPAGSGVVVQEVQEVQGGPADVAAFLAEAAAGSSQIVTLFGEGMDQVDAELTAQGLKFRSFGKRYSFVYFLNKLIPQVRQNGHIWMVYNHVEEQIDRNGATLQGVLDEHLLQDHEVEIERRIGPFAVLKVVNRLSAEGGAVRLDSVAKFGGVPTAIKFSPDGDLMFVASKTGLLEWRSMSRDVGGTVLQLPRPKGGSAGIFFGGESGLVGLALHPEFPRNARIYIHYNWQKADKSREAIISEWQLDIADDAINARSERVLMRIPQPEMNHNAGELAFGPQDGDLYIAVGDGEEGEWVRGRSPSHTMRGKILRIDLDSRAGDKEYGIPADNPFVGNDKFPPETWAWGFRNPWRFCFVPDGRIVVGEIGEDRFEEITFARGGAHHGWPYVEGHHRRVDWDLGDIPVEPPLMPYGREYGMSVIGGYVYGNDSMPWLKGKYVCGDYLSGRIWALDLPAPGTTWEPMSPDDAMELGRWPKLFTTFGLRPDGRLYVGTNTGEVLELAESEGGAPSEATTDTAAVPAGVIRGMFQAEIPSPGPADSSAAEIALGAKLFSDPRLSADGRVSCATCHALDAYGQDGLALAAGGGRRNTPSVFNAHRQFAQFWDYRSETVEDAALQHLLTEHGFADDAAVAERLRGIDEYRGAFEGAFAGSGEAVTAEHAARAIGAFVRQLVTSSRWEAFLDGDDSALTAEEQRGLSLFVSVGCVSCHQNRTMGGSMPQKLGLVESWQGSDRGRGEIGDGVDYYFKVSPLLNVEHTAPYYHDGSIATLDEAVRHMARVQLGRTLDDDQVASMVTFLESLSGEKPAILD